MPLPVLIRKNGREEYAAYRCNGISLQGNGNGRGYPTFGITAVTRKVSSRHLEASRSRVTSELKVTRKVSSICMPYLTIEGKAESIIKYLLNSLRLCIIITKPKLQNGKEILDRVWVLHDTLVFVMCENQLVSHKS